MSEVAIKVENVSKKYLLSHQSQERYTALRDVLANGIKHLGQKLIHPKTSHLINNTTEEEFFALNKVNFEIQQGDRVGIIGRNGAGKSTLLKILSRITDPTNGRIEITGRVASLLEVGTGFHPELTGRENISLNGAILGMGRAEIKRKFDQIVDFAEVERFLDTPVKRYSSGMYVRLAFAVAAHLEPEILIVDEVLAVGDAQFQKKCLGKMEQVGKEGRTVLFVSHNMGVINNLCNHCILLDKGEIAALGKTSEIIGTYANLSMQLLSDQSPTPGVLYLKEISDSARFEICQVRIADENGDTLRNVKSLEDFAVYIKFYSPKVQKNGSVTLFFKNLTDTVLLRYATRPDSCLDMDFQEGINEIRCNIKKLPLPPGTYILSVGLAIPMREWLYLTPELCYIEIGFNDVHGTGYIPQQQHAAAVTEYNWEIVKD